MKKCSHCGAELETRLLGGLCPKCALERAKSKATIEGGGVRVEKRQPITARGQPSPEKIQYFGDYEL
jgi:hypothetical protein